MTADELEAAIVTREAEVVGKPQRIEPLPPEEFDEELTALVLAMRASFNAPAMTQIPEMFGVMLKHPALFRCQMDMSIQLVANSSFTVRERELTILRVAWRCRAPFEWGQHVQIAHRYAIEPEAIERVTQGPTAEGWTPHERAILTAVDDLLGDQRISDPVWDALAAEWDERQLLEFPILIGQYYTIALQQNALRMRLETGNIGLRRR